MSGLDLDWTAHLKNLLGKRLGAILLFVVLVAIGGALLWSGSRKEPSYGGRSLSRWLRDLHNPKSTPAKQQEARQAIQAMGTNVIPLLVAAADRSHDGFLSPFARLANGFGLQYRLPMHWAWSSAGMLQLWASQLDDATRREAARVVFSAYVSCVRSDPRQERRAMNLANTLMSLGDPALTLLAASLTNAEPRLRANAASLMGFRPGMPTNFIGALAERISDPDVQVRTYAIDSLGRFRKNGLMVVPLLRQALLDSEPHVRFTAVRALVLLGLSAKPAVPDLIAAGERDALVRPMVLEYLRGIDPEEAERVAARFQKPQ